MRTVVEYADGRARRQANMRSATPTRPTRVFSCIPTNQKGAFNLCFWGDMGDENRLALRSPEDVVRHPPVLSLVR